MSYNVLITHTATPLDPDTFVANFATREEAVAYAKELSLTGPVTRVREAAKPSPLPKALTKFLTF